MRLPNFEFHDLKPAVADFRREVLAGLTAAPRRIAPKFFYDAEGSRLFDQITQLDAYYPTRTEIALLKAHGQAMGDLLGRGSALIELGSGSDLKIRTVLDALAPAEYLPLDISGSHLRDAAVGIARDYPPFRCAPPVWTTPGSSICRAWGQACIGWRFTRARASAISNRVR